MLSDQTRRDELARFLRDKRANLKPQDFGIISTGQRRRAVGLRREEIADAAGISTTWYVWLEQGRAVSASAHALRSLCKAMRLNQQEQAYLFRLARPDQGPTHTLDGEEGPSDVLLNFINGLWPHPAYILNRYWDVVAMNEVAEMVLGPFHAKDAWGRNLIARLFLDPAWRTLFVEWPGLVRSAVAQYRLATVSLTDDPVRISQVRMLEAHSPEFCVLWNDWQLADPPIWQKTLRVPEAGNMTFDFATFQPTGPDSEFMASIYTPADTKTRNKLSKLLKGAKTGINATAGDETGYPPT